MTALLFTVGAVILAASIGGLIGLAAARTDDRTHQQLADHNAALQDRLVDLHEQLQRAIATNHRIYRRTRQLRQENIALLEEMVRR